MNDNSKDMPYPETVEDWERIHENIDLEELADIPIPTQVIHAGYRAMVEFVADVLGEEAMYEGRIDFVWERNDDGELEYRAYFWFEDEFEEKEVANDNAGGKQTHH